MTVIQVRDGGRDQDDGNIISEKWSALGYTLKVQATELPNTLNVRCERKKGVRGSLQCIWLTKLAGWSCHKL